MQQQQGNTTHNQSGNVDHIANLIAQAKYLKDNHQQDSDKYQQVYEELYNNQVGITKYENPKTNELIEESLSEAQVYQIRQQVLAYKYLVRNMNLPVELSRNIQNISQDQWNIESDRIMQRSLKFYNEKVEKNNQLKQLIKDKIQKKENYQEQADNTSKYFIEKNQHFIDKRKVEIQKVLQQADWFSQECIEKLQCELKLLNQLSLYQQVQGQLVNKLKKKPKTEEEPQQFNIQLLDRAHFKREKPPKKQGDINVDKIENSIKQEQARRKKKKIQLFMMQLQSHHTQFRNYHTDVTKRCVKINKKSRQFLEIREKKKQEQAEREEQKRVQALRENDWDAYTKLIKESKNSRIIELLQKTDKYLKELGAKVVQQKGEGQKDGEDDEDEEDLELEREYEDAELRRQQKDGNYDIQQANKTYYNLTHTVDEQVTEQPSILVGGKLKSYQLIGLTWMVSLFNNKLNGILADEMGLGKTIQTISLFTYLIETKKIPGPFLVVIPLATMSNWVMEFEKWAPSVQTIVYKGTPPVRKELQKQIKQTKWHVIITTYEYIQKDKLILSKPQWKYIVVDEGHRMKNAKSKFAMTLGQQYQSDYRILLTGTPLQNNLSELWALLNFLLPKVFGSCEEFEKWFSIPLQNVAVSTDKEQTSLNEEEKLLIITRLHQVLRPFVLRRVKKEVEKELPDKVEHVVKVEISQWQKLQEQQIRNKQQNIYNHQTGKVENKALQNLMMQLRKIANHPYLFYDEEPEIDDQIWRVSGKFELLDRIIPKMKATGHKILLFTQMTKLLDLLELYFTFRGFSYFRLDGQTKEEDRGQRINAFNAKDSKIDVFMLSTRAGGLGLNLQTADTVIIFDSDWNPQQDLQAQDRAHRIGQKNEVRVLRFVTNTFIEKEILNKASQKIHLDDMLIQTGMYNNKATEEDRRRKVEEMLVKGQRYEEVQDDIPTDEQVNDMLARSEDEFELFQKMDQERYEVEKNIYPNFVYPPTERQQYEKEDEQIQNQQQGESIKKDENNGDDINNNEEKKEQSEIQDTKKSKELEGEGEGEGEEEQEQKGWFNYRLCSLEDVPEYIRNPPKTKEQEEDIKDFGRGNRSRKAINYSDEQNELKFLKTIAVDPNSGDEVDDDREVVKRRDEQVVGEGQSGNQKAYLSDDEQIEEEDDDDEEFDVKKELKKSGRVGRRVAANRPSLKQDSDDDMEQKTKSGRGRGRGRGRPSKKRGNPNWRKKQGEQEDDEQDEQQSQSIKQGNDLKHSPQNITEFEVQKKKKLKIDDSEDDEQNNENQQQDNQNQQQQNNQGEQQQQE